MWGFEWWFLVCFPSSVIPLFQCNTSHVFGGSNLKRDLLSEVYYV